MNRRLDRNVGLLWLGCLLLVTRQAPAEDRAPLDLLPRDSLAGWDYGDVRGWRWVDGRLVGDSDSSPLVSGFLLGNGTVQIQAESRGDALLVLQLLGTDDSSLLEIPLPATPAERGEKIAATINRRGQSVSVSDGRRFDGDLEAPCFLGLRIAQGTAAIDGLAMQPKPGPAIFNGHDLTGWLDLAGHGLWQASSEQTLLKPANHVVAQAGYLRTARAYENFTLALDYRLASGGNSGIAIRTPDGGWPSNDGYELQLFDGEAKPGEENLAIYRNVRPRTLAYRPGQWNEVVIQAVGPLITAWNNGVLVQHVQTRDHPELRNRSLRGWIGLQDHLDQIEFRDIRLTPHPDGSPRAPWQGRPRSESPFAALDRLMNFRQLAEPDPVSTQTLAPSADRGSEQVLLDVAGPGVLLSVAAEHADGQLRIAVDDQSPREIACRPEALAGALPGIRAPLPRNKFPVLTWLPFARRLRVEADERTHGRLDLTVATQPESSAHMSVEELAATFDQAWKSALQYRVFRHQFNSIPHEHIGTQVHGDAATLAPGERAEIIDHEGAGAAVWLRLECDLAELQTRDLWLEICVDDQEQPSIACPARMWFAPLAGGTDHASFVTTRSDGFVSRLAIPYERRLNVTLRNRGTRPIVGLGVTACVDSSPVASSPRRLRAHYDDVAEAGAAIELTGRGRLVGLVLDDAAEYREVIESTSIDGALAPGWSHLARGGLLGTGDSTSPRQLGPFSGCDAQLAWRYFLLAPIDYQAALDVRFADAVRGPRLLLYYEQSP